MLNFLTTTTVCGFSLYHVLAFFLIYSCTGWCLEVIFAAATTGQLVNRGFLNGPVCPIYGFGMVIVLFALTPLQGSVLLLYIGGVILPSALELVGGWALYKLYHTRWWDYSDFPFNIGGYICLEFSLLWGVGTLVVMRIVHPVVAGLVDMVPPFVGFVVMCVLYAVYAADVVVTAFAASGVRIPPLAFTFARPPTVFFINATSSTVAPPVDNPVEVFTKSAPAFTDNSHARTFSSSVRRQVSIITFTTAPLDASTTARISSST